MCWVRSVVHQVQVNSLFHLSSFIWDFNTDTKIQLWLKASLNQIQSGMDQYSFVHSIFYQILSFLLFFALQSYHLLLLQDKIIDFELLIWH